ncbi:helix-turn-helix transcriptional regulator [Rhodococcus sp. BP-349]|nr:helix-turn-helix transcriptional regulator [Rhodococcus sp. BP-363]MBY6543558.1 helix-turn-helix transcriptional regulator [Rhodococcus sp. BP-369]MBY6562788.1 helix-turn-helix transcriptional regulator [Rhodococcus sp. BP-370]MBY6577080.1 helix-turn-helix transcriptional regulator [Rhodococcus sp. BP-364]MBY6586381.1 helix-turn-helix transcriptional regulator [Rhodococcus sp. BP-358]MBY6590718.1 helix-turn-helix transcriptional regulator [Rhodococcus sp. BP-362]MBY6595948.1 helix-turn-hel
MDRSQSADGELCEACPRRRGPPKSWLPSCPEQNVRSSQNSSAALLRRAGGPIQMQAMMTDDDIVRPALSVREVEVLRAWIISDSKGTVARSLFISPATVNTHIARIREKYEAVGRSAGSKASLVARALQDGHVGLDEL